jgi:hypothetical protein
VPKTQQAILATRAEMITSQVERELGVIFGGAGSRVVMKECCATYGVSAIDAFVRPEAFRSALNNLVGDLGSTMVMGRIGKRVSELGLQ